MKTAENCTLVLCPGGIFAIKMGTKRISSDTTLLGILFMASPIFIRVGNIHIQKLFGVLPQFFAIGGKCHRVHSGCRTWELYNLPRVLVYHFVSRHLSLKKLMHLFH